MPTACDICRAPEPELDPRELLPGLDVREHRLLDRALHSACLADWVYRREFTRSFHDAARHAGRPELTLAADGTVHLGRPPRRLFAGAGDALLARLRLLPFRGDGLVERFRHYNRIARVVTMLLLVIVIAATGVGIGVVAWPYGALVGGMLLVVAWILAAHVWRWSPMILSQQPGRPWWS